jgi:hypothetical protein
MLIFECPNLFRTSLGENKYAIGGGDKGLEKFPDHVTSSVGSNFKETFRLVVEWLEKRKLM